MSALHGTNRDRPYVRKEFLQRLFWLGVICLAVWGFYEQAGRKLLRPIARRQIKELTGANVKISSVDFRSNCVVRMKDLVIGAKADTSDGGVILSAKTVDARFSLISLFKLQPRIKSITINDFTINARYDMDTGRWNLDLLKIKKTSDDGESLPDLKIKKGIFEVSRVADGVVETIAKAGVSGDFTGVWRNENKYKFYIETDDRYDFGKSYLRGIWESGKKGSLNMNGKFLMADSAVFGNAWDVKNLTMELEYDSTDIRIEQLEWNMGDKTEVRITGAINNYPVKPEYDVKLHLKDLLLSAKPKADTLVYSKPVLNKLGRRLRWVLEWYSPQGRGDIDIRCIGFLSELSKTELSGIITCKDISIRDKTFPYLIDHMTGSIEMNETGVVLNNLHGSHGDVDLNINGYTKVVDNQPEYDIQITSTNMKFDDDLYRALKTRHKKLWFIFTPSGLARTHQRFSRSAGQERKSILTVDLVDVQAIYQHFPYPLKNLTGRVTFEPGRLVLDNVVSEYDDRRISLDGKVTETESDRPRFNITINAVDVPIDNTLMIALPANQRKFYEHFDVDALTDVEIKVFPNEVDRRLVEYIAKISIKGTSLIYEKFPLQLTEVYLDAILTPDYIELKKMTGKSGQGRVYINGKIWPGNEGHPSPDFYLVVDANGIELNDDLLRSLPEELSLIVTPLQPSGKVNVSAILNIGTRQENYPDYNVTIECLENSFNFERLPYPIENVTGFIRITRDEIELDNITATGAGDGSAEVDMTKVVVNGKARYRMGEGLLGGRASFKADGLKIKSRLLENLHGDIIYDPNKKAFISRGFTADCYGGKVIGDVELKQLDDRDLEYIFQLVFDNVEVRDILSVRLRQSQKPDTHTQGNMNGSFSAQGLLGDKASSTGRLILGISDMRLTRRSVLGKILIAMQLNKPTDFIFSDLKVEAYLKGTEIIFEHVYMSGSSTVLQGNGKMDLVTNEIDMNFTAFGRILTSNPSMLESLAKSLGSAVVKIEVHGNLDEPLIKTTTLPVFKTPLDLLGDKERL